jgi:hypothetical protein
VAIKTFINRLIQSSSLYFGFENTWWKVIPETRAWRGRDHMVVRFATTYAISAYHHWSCEFESHSWRGVLDTTLCDKVGQWLATGWRFSPGAPVCSTNNTDRWNIVESGVNHKNPNPNTKYNFGMILYQSWNYIYIYVYLRKIHPISFTNHMKLHAAVHAPII